MFAVEGGLTIYTVGELKGQLLEKLVDARTPSALDLSAVSEFDAAGLQLLLALKRQMAAAAKVWSVVGASSCVREALQLSGVELPWAGSGTEEAA
ncbi:MAG: STAS domain-containing protein [Steroidobacteraceae bacterium]